MTRPNRVVIVNNVILGRFKSLQTSYEKKITQGFRPNKTRYKYIGRCYYCGIPFVKGDRIIYLNHGKWVHEKCYHEMFIDIEDDFTEDELEFINGTIPLSSTITVDQYRGI
ncbi:MAG: hypothetical protein QXW80_03050 [Candidatus Micrarchaeia archaeon]|uniref:hypothetical protein n=1 Tax=Saccharolobus sp. TaxID=2100761 RepID=UPI00317DD32A